MLMRTLLALLAFAPAALPGDPGTVLAHEKISATFGGFSGPLADGDLFASSLTSPGDLDGDGRLDLVAGAPGSDDGRGAVWLLELGEQGGVLGEHRLDADDVGGLPDGAGFGMAVAGLGDLDRNGTPDLAVGAPGSGSGEVRILFLEADGSVASSTTISEGVGGFAGDLDGGDLFGCGLANVGDLDGDGVPELAVGAPGDDDGKGPNSGAVWILFLADDGSVSAAAKVSDALGDFGGILDEGDRFGVSLAGLGDLDGDGTEDLAVGSFQDDDPAQDDDDTEQDIDAGAVWILFLDVDASVLHAQKISNRKGGLFGCDWDDALDELFDDPDVDDVQEAVTEACLLDANDRFGSALAAPGDVDGDGVRDLVVGLRGDDDGGVNTGALFVLFLRDNGTVRDRAKISDTKGKFSGKIDKRDRFGSALAAFDASLGSPPDGGETARFLVAVGAPDDDDGAEINDAERGAAWLLALAGFDGLDTFDGPLTANGRVRGAVTAGGRHGFDVELVAGSRLTVVARARKGAALPQVGIEDPSDVEVVAPADSVVKPGRVKVTKLDVDATGTWHLELENPSTGGGDYQLRTKVQAPLSDAVDVVVPAAGPGFEAVAGWTLKRLVVSAAGGSELLPVVALRGPDGALRDITAATQTNAKGTKVEVRDVALDETGTWTVEVSGASGSAGAGRVRWTLEALKPDGVLEVSADA